MKNYKHFVAIVAILLAAAIWPPITNAFEKSSCSNNSTTNWYVDKNIDNPSTIFQALSSEQKSNHTFHLFSHGRPGELLINGEWKNAQQIAAFLSKEMPSNCTHLNIYGCSFARGDLGKKAMSFLNDKLNLTIAASNNTTGIDGDWNLEEGTPKESISVSNYLGNLQTTVYVNATATGSGNGSSWSNGYTTLNAALNANANISPLTVLVAAGTYNEPSNAQATLMGATVSISGGYNINTGVSNPASTPSILNYSATTTAGGSGASVGIISYNGTGGSFTMQGLTIQNLNQSALGGGVPTSSNFRGTSFYINNSNTTSTQLFKDLILTNNTKTTDLFQIGNPWPLGSPTSTSTVTFDNVNANNNSTSMGVLNYVGTGVLTIKNSNFCSNTSSGNFAGALYYQSLTGGLIIDNTIFQKNTLGNGTGLHAGAILICNEYSNNMNANITIKNSSFIANTDAAGFTGNNCTGGIYVSGFLTQGSVLIDNNQFINNQGPYSGAIQYTSAVNGTISNNTFNGNSAFGQYGLAGAIAGTGNATILNNNFVNNTGVSGSGAIYGNGFYLTLTGNNFNNNTRTNSSTTIPTDISVVNSTGTLTSNNLQSSSTLYTNEGYTLGTGNNFNGASSIAVASITTPSTCITLCNAGSIAPAITTTSATNVCPATGVNLNSYVSNAGLNNLVWFTNNTHTGSAITNSSSVGAGTYYAFFYDSTNNCYSPASSAINISIITCSPSYTTCTPTEYICNGSFEKHTTAICPNLNTGTLPTNTVDCWNDGTNADPTYMVYDPTNACNYNKPASTWPANTALTGGHTGNSWFGIGVSPGDLSGYNKVLVNRLNHTLPVGTYTLTFYAGHPTVNEALTTCVDPVVTLWGWQPGEEVFYGISSAAQWGAYTTGKLMGKTTGAITNVLTSSSTSGDWVKYSITFTTTTTIASLGILSSTASSYFYIDDVSLQAVNTDYCCTTADKTGPYCDYDGDGILNNNDLDDDNDGILDAAENPSCFYSATEVQNVNGSSWATSLASYPSTDMEQNGSLHAPFLAFDGNADGNTWFYLAHVTNTDWINKTVIKWQYNAALPISGFNIMLNQLWWLSGNSINLYFGTVGSTIKLQGSANGTTWVDLSAPTDAYNNKQITLLNTLQSTSSFQYYRIIGWSGAYNYPYPATINEIAPIINSSIYNPSSNPKPNCTSPLDTDGDGIANMFDLDSDGDGCADAVEGGATFNYANLSPSNISGGNTGVNYSGIVNYGVTSNLGNVVSTSGSTIGIPTIATVGQTVGTSQNVGQKDALCCPAGSTAPTLTTTSATNTCPATGVNLFNYISSNFSNIVWFTNNTHTGSAITTASSASAGTYYAFYYDVTENCYSPASAAFTVVTTSCVPVTNNCNPVEYITNGSFECHVNTCVNFNIGTIPTNEVCGWYDGTVYDPTFMMYDGVNNCIYNMPASNYPPASAITGGHTGQAWMGIGQSAFSSVHALVNTMQYTLAPGTHTLTFWAGVLPQIQPFFGGYANTGPTALTLYGYAPGEAVVFSDFGTVTGSNLGSTPVITNYITSNNQTWVQYSMTFTNTKPMSRLSLMHYNNAYVYIDDISIMDVNQMCCTTTDKSGLYCDYDSDGILNANDLDDDNDGIMDAVENPSCFYTAAEVTGNATSYATTVKLPILTEMKMSAALFPMESAFDGLNPYAPQSLPTVGTGWSIWDQDWVNKTLIQWQYNAAIPVTQFTIYQNNYPGYMFGTAGSTIKLQGSVDGTNWLDLSYPVSAYTDIAFSLPNTLQAGVSFNYYRLRGVTGSSIRENKAIVEIAPTINTTAYNPSVNPKTNCSTPLDTDGDGIANMFDLDSDGDGCADAVEGGATFNYANLLSSTIPGGNTGIAYSGIVNYGVTSNLGNIVSTSGSTIGIPTISGAGQTIGTSQNVGQKDAACCLAGSTAPALTATTATNVCPATGVNLNSYVSNAGLNNIVWFTNNTHTGSPITTAGSAGAGTYYAFFYDYVNDCYSPVSNAINVSFTSCVPTGVVCGNINYFKNPSFDCYNLCPVWGANKQTNTVCGWLDAGYADPQFMVYDAAGGCVYNRSNGDPINELTQGHTGKTWMGLANSDFTNFSTMHPLAGVLEAPLQPGTYTLKFWAGRLNDPGYFSQPYTNNPVVKLYGLDSLHQQPWTTGFYGEVTGTINPTLGTVTVSNILNSSSTSSNWQQYSITFTTTKVFKSLVIYHQTAGAYLMVDDMELLATDPYCCDATSNNKGMYCDYDTDGKLNWEDLDDDNDGILDAVENPTCFYSATEVNTNYPTFATTAQNITTGLINLGSYTSIFNAFDGNVALSPPVSGYANYATFQSYQVWGGKTLFAWNYNAPIAVTGFTMLASTAYPTVLGYTGSTIMLMGSSDGTTWQQLSQVVAADVSTNITLNNTLQPNTAFKYYKIIGVSGSTGGTDVCGAIVEVVPNVNTALYIPSSNPKANCTSPLDTDNDGIANMFDLDSDGDGCTDALEGGANLVYSDLKTSSIAGGNTGTNYTGTANYPVISNLGNVVNTFGIPTIAGSGQTIGTSQNVGQKDAACTVTGTNPDFNVTYVNVPVSGNVSTNDIITIGTTYGTPVAVIGNPSTSTPILNPNGTYTFAPSATGVYKFLVPVCASGQSTNCPTELLTITVLDKTTPNINNPVANTDFASTITTTPVVIKTLSNDKPGDPATILNPASITILDAPNHGSFSINLTNGDITYYATNGFTGIDTLIYQVCDNGVPTQCATAYQIIDVLPSITPNSTVATDDYNTTAANTPVSGNVLANDMDPEGNFQTVTAQFISIQGKGSFVLNTNGTYTFTPLNGFSGPVEIPYTVTDNGNPVATATATLRILVQPIAPTTICTLFPDPTAAQSQFIIYSPSGISTGSSAQGAICSNGAIAGTLVKIKFTNINGTIPSNDNVYFTINEVSSFNPLTTYPNTSTIITLADLMSGSYIYTLLNSGALGLQLSYTIQGTSATNFSYTWSIAALCNPLVPAITKTTTTNTCPSSTVDLTLLANTATIPVGASLVWSTHNLPLSSSDYLTTTQAQSVTAGKYYAYFRDNTTGCFSSADSIIVTITSCDADGDGVPDIVETSKGTNPNDPCSYNVADISAPITSTVDCDGDGVTDKNEIYGPDGVITGTDGTDPKNPCSLNLSQVTVVATSTGDCDGDGVTNANEINSNGAGDPRTNPNDPCNYNTAEQVIANTTATWKALDCDKDGNNNGTDPNPKVPTAVGDAMTAPTGVTTTINILTNDDFLPGVNTSITKTGGTAGGTVTFNPLTGTISYVPLATEIGTVKTVIYNVCNTAVTTQVCDTAIVTITIPLDPDTDGDGVPDKVETTKGTNPNDPCSYNVADISAPITSTVDCDGDGVTDKNEIYGPDGVITGTDGTDPKNPCSFNLSQVTMLATSTGDCDGDGVTNANEINSTGAGDPRTNPNDPCDYNTAEQVIANTTATWKALDCDKDGNNNGTDPNPKVPTAIGDAMTAPTGVTTTINILTNDDFLPGANTSITKTGGTAGGTVTFNPLTGTISYVPLATEIGTVKTVIYNVCNTAVTPQVCDTAIVTITIPLDADTDGDGVKDSKEITDGTDPNNPCSFILASQTVTPTTTWMNSDCDGDGVTNQKEKIDGTNPLNGCSYIISSITLTRSSTWNASDCDGDGVPNGKEITDGTDPLDPCKLIVASQTLPTTSTWKALDCDGDGVPNGVEITDGTNPLNPDTDGDGVTDGKEKTDGTNPLISCDFILASQTVATSAAWKLLDCDGDGVTNQQEIIDGTNPLNPCSYLVSKQTLATTSTWKALDCDGDGVTNGKEVTDGTDPLDPCKLIVASQTLPTTSTWKAIDCDGDGVTNGVEITDGTNPLVQDTDGDGVTDGKEKIDGTNPLIPCDFILASQTVATSAAWKLLDCDGDGVTNQQEIADGTNPLNSCSFKLASQTVATSASWKSIDCDGDGVVNGKEITDGTDPNNLCSFIFASQTVTPSLTWMNTDCDGDGNRNGTDPHPLTPTAVNDNMTAPVGTTTTLNILTNDDFLPGSTTSITKIGGTAGGTVTFNPLTGVMSYIPLVSEAGTTKTVIYYVCNTAINPNVCATATVTIVVPSSTDSDGDGVPDTVEITKGTNPNDPCSYNIADITLPIISTVDCDGDGVTDKNEIYGPDGVITGLDGTDPKNPCSLNLSQVTEIATSTGDCDGDGVTNADEINSKVSDPRTNPNDPCNYNAVEQVLANTSATWKNLDCDGDGNKNGTDPNPKVPTAIGDVMTAPTGVTTTVNILANDDFLPGATTSITKTGGTAGGTVTFNPLTGVMSYIPLASEAGTTKTVIYSVCNTAVSPNVCDTAIVTISITADLVKLSMKVLLEGSMFGVTSTTGVMYDKLRTYTTGNLIPLSDPYKTSAYRNNFVSVNNANTQLTTAAVLGNNTDPNNDIVDWVFIELRDQNTPSLVVSTFSALVQRDGDVVDPADGISPVSISKPAGNYYVSVRHRNHLGIMTAQPIALSITPTVIDFINMSDANVWNQSGYDGLEGQRVPGNRRALWACNTNMNNNVKFSGLNNDSNPILTAVLNEVGNTTDNYGYIGTIGYYLEDVNMDGRVRYNSLFSDANQVLSSVLNYPLNAVVKNYSFVAFLQQLP